MKLSARYNRISIITAIIVLLASSVCYYAIIRYALINQLDQDLQIEEQEVFDFVKINHALPTPSNYEDQQISFELLTQSVQRKFSSRYIFDSTEKEKTPVRQLIFPIVVNGKNYKVVVSKSQEETEDLIQQILVITLGTVIVLLLMLFLLNRILLRKLWQPFNITLKELKQFDLTIKPELQLTTTSINEFAELNQAVRMMAERVNKDYNTLKTFTENASHEMQTPLAVINSRLDILIQDETISSGQMKLLEGVYDSLGKLSRLVQSLLLLAKIENNQFNETTDIRLDELVKEKIIQLEELAQVENLTITVQLDNTAIKTNRYLVDILISNLFNNAIRYNKKDGTINILLRDNKLTFSNTSSIASLDEQKVFQRFYRYAGIEKNGNGLGLSIIKQISDIAGYLPQYKYHNNLHEFSITF
ncbi:sensor histidine kinase [Ferruginibacter albus]|uniref:sensor histidine kinase n=1 Tax=Ferruginibacter albus TaxID=2875540 RepID=UPI001CC4E78A|nr:HAMP domain-containing sensor histidine kinase [Ferruginibacter albus]UAY51250.1 HAMP domain-containing histidine kinase [Ferruginibacter albus]